MKKLIPTLLVFFVSLSAIAQLQISKSNRYLETIDGKPSFGLATRRGNYFIN